MFHISVPIIHYSCNITEAEGGVGVPWGRFRPPNIFILTVPRRYFCCGSLLLLVLAVRIYTLVQLLCWWRVLWVLGGWVANCLRGGCSFGLLRVPFVGCRRFVCSVVSLLVLRAGCGIWLYQFLIIAYHFTLSQYFSCYTHLDTKCTDFNDAPSFEVNVTIYILAKSSNRLLLKVG